MTNVNPGLILRGCPFCGRIPQIKAVRFGMEEADRYGVVCYGCAICIGWENSEEAAVERWNRREGEKDGTQTVPVLRKRCGNT